MCSAVMRLVPTVSQTSLMHHAIDLIGEIDAALEVAKRDQRRLRVSVKLIENVSAPNKK